MNRHQIGVTQPFAEPRQQGFVDVFASRHHREKVRLVRHHQMLVDVQDALFERHRRLVGHLAEIMHAHADPVRPGRVDRLHVGIQHPAAGHAIEPVARSIAGKRSHRQSSTVGQSPWGRCRVLGRVEGASDRVHNDRSVDDTRSAGGCLLREAPRQTRDESTTRTADEPGAAFRPRGRRISLPCPGHLAGAAVDLELVLLAVLLHALAFPAVAIGFDAVQLGVAGGLGLSTACSRVIQSAPGLSAAKAAPEPGWQQRTRRSVSCCTSRFPSANGIVSGLWCWPLPEIRAQRRPLSSTAAVCIRRLVVDSGRCQTTPSQGIAARRGPATDPCTEVLP